ncbi:MAG: SIR2 family protein [Candidatus Eisenbacteria bacterium]|nr:SIR2 family protein [Candidatus Eisenbacteria bacterium]
MMDTLQDELRRAVAKNPRDLVVLVGAGVTKGALVGELRELASWQGLLTDAVREGRALGRIDAGEASSLQQVLAGQDTDAWITAAESITTSLGGVHSGDFGGWLRRSAGAFERSYERTPTLEALAELARRGAVLATVNYDGVLEDLTGLPPVTWADPSQVLRVLRGEERGILHLHGHWDEPASVVFGTRSYEAVIDDPATQAAMRAIMVLRTMLFVGHGAGLRDPNWGAFLRWAEATVAKAEHRHYPLVRASEQATVQTEHPPGQRVVAVSYGAEHADLGPFLKGLVPQTKELHEEAGSTKTLVLLVNIGDRDDSWMTPEKLARAAEFPPGERVFLELAIEIDRRAIDGAGWRELAERLDVYVRQAEAKVDEIGATRCVVAGQAPLPAFAYLGQRLQGMIVPICFVNLQRGKAVWDVVNEPQASPTGQQVLFEATPPPLGRDRQGRMVLGVQCGGDYGFGDAIVEDMITEEGGRLLGSYGIVRSEGHRTAPLVPTDLDGLMGRVDEALAWMAKERVTSQGLTVALGGPAWVAFWVGHRLNPNNFGHRLDFPNFAGGRYVSALSVPMRRAQTRARLLFIGAEPDNQGKTRGALLGDVFGKYLPRDLVRVIGAVTVPVFQKALAEHPPDILHIHAHGGADQSGALAFEADGWRSQQVEGQAVVELIRASGVRPRLVVLSACYSETLGEALLGLAECVVFTTTALKYKEAFDFAEGLYEALGRGDPVGRAIRQARSRVGAMWREGAKAKIQWKAAPGRDVETMVLFPRGAGSRG